LYLSIYSFNWGKVISVEIKFSKDAVLYSNYWKTLDCCFFGTNVIWYNDVAK